MKVPNPPEPADIKPGAAEIRRPGYGVDPSARCSSRYPIHFDFGLILIDTISRFVPGLGLDDRWDWAGMATETDADADAAAGWAFARRLVSPSGDGDGDGDGDRGWWDRDPKRARVRREFGRKGAIGPVQRGGARSRQVRQFALGFGYRPSAIGQAPPLHSPSLPQGRRKIFKIRPPCHGRDSWIMEHGSWAMAHGSWLIDRGIWALGHHRGTECLPFSRCPTGRLPEVPVNRAG